MTPTIVDPGTGPIPVTKRQLLGLLLANQIITSDLALPAVLRRIVESACQLVDAKYGALGVIGPDGELEQFIQVGIDEDLAARIGDLPKGRGVLGMLIKRPAAIRIDDLEGDPHAVGLPRHHPPMTAFLGVPIRVREEIFGNLYLTEPAAGTFTAEDEELVTALASAAGVAIDNARLYDDARRGQTWLRASAEITRELMSHGNTDPLGMIVETAQELGGADLVAVLLPSTDERLRAAVAAGVGADHFRGMIFDAESRLGRAIARGEGLLYPDVAELSSPDYENPYRIGPMMVAPLADAQHVRGALLLARTIGRRPFTTADLNMAATFANHVALALELADARADAERVSLLEDRDRIARDLHDHVIQRLFATGLGLEGLATGAADDEVARRLADHITDLDETIRQIRASIFQLQHGGQGRAVSIRARLLDLVESSTRMLGFRPEIRFSGPVDSLVDPELGEDLLAVTREALSNIGRHARATAAAVSVGVTASDVVIDISDDGIGLTEHRPPDSGLANLRRRATTRGGEARLTRSNLGGVRLHWQAPLDGPLDRGPSEGVQ